MGNVGLVLEGGGMRGVYTAGVLEFFMEKKLYFPYVIGVSAGACHAASYLSRQKGRNKKVTIDFVKHPRYLSVRNMVREKQLFGMDFIFDDIPNNVVPFDFEAFHKATEQFLIGTTDCETGKAVYFTKQDHRDSILTVLRASSSLPLAAPIIDYSNQKLLDGGIADPIPLKKSEQDGNKKNVLILTRNAGYIKQKSKMEWLPRHAYRKFPRLVDTMSNRYNHYNETLTYINEQENNGNVFVIRPNKPLKVGRIERNSSKLIKLYEQGYEDSEHLYNDLLLWLEK